MGCCSAPQNNVNESDSDVAGEPLKNGNDNSYQIRGKYLDSIKIIKDKDKIPTRNNINDMNNTNHNGNHCRTPSQSYSMFNIQSMYIFILYDIVIVLYRCESEIK